MVFFRVLPSPMEGLPTTVYSLKKILTKFVIATVNLRD